MFDHMSIQTLRSRIISLLASKTGLWLLGIGALLFWVWSDSWCPTLYWTVMAAFEYAVVAYLMRVGAGFGHATYDEFRNNGALRAFYLAVSGLFLLALGFFFISISLKPGSPLYIFTLRRGRGACVVILGSILYGFFAARRNNTPHAYKSPEPTAVGAVRSAVAVHVASRRWLSFFR